MDSSNEFIERINQLKTDFYSNHKKNTFFKSAQKMECATTVSTNINLELLLKNTAFVIRDSNHVFLDYTIFKTYVTEVIYENVVQYFTNLIVDTIQKYGDVIVHINLSTFSTSACHRYKKIIELFLGACLKNETEFSKKLTVMHIYNTPNLFENIITMLKPFIHPDVKNKIVYHSKSESAELLQHLNTNHL